MSETAKERAEAIWLEWPTEKDRTHDTFIRLVSAHLRAHADAALERAWNASASIETTGKDPQRVQDEMLAAILALREEEG